MNLVFVYVAYESGKGKLSRKTATGICLRLRLISKVMSSIWGAVAVLGNNCMS